MELKPLASGYVAAILSANIMLLLEIVGNLEAYSKAVYRMQHWNRFFSLSITGIIAGMVGSMVISLCADMILQYCTIDSIRG